MSTSYHLGSALLSLLFDPLIQKLLKFFHQRNMQGVSFLKSFFEKGPRASKVLHFMMISDVQYVEKFATFDFVNLV